MQLDIKQRSGIIINGKNIYPEYKIILGGKKMSKFNVEKVRKLKVIEIATFIANQKCTIREAAKNFKMSKSTVYRYMVEELPKHSTVLTKKVKNVLNCNKLNRHIRGGIATKIKYEMLKSKK